MKSLNALIDDLPDEELQTVPVDISSFYKDDAGQPLPERTVVFTYRSPSVSEFFRAGDDGKKLKKLYPRWTEDQCTSVALLALAHVDPAPESGSEGKAKLYAKIAEKKGLLFLHLQKRFFEAFPHLKNLQEAQDEAGED